MADLRERLREVNRLDPPDLWAEAHRRAAAPARPVMLPRPSRLGRVAAGVVAVAVFAAAAAVATRAFVGGKPQPRSNRASSPWTGIGGGWTELAPPPFARSDAATVWTGEELLLWGGGTDYTANLFADGAAFDPSTGWRDIEAGPLEARADPVVVWTGTEMIVWGGFGRSGRLNDGAAYTDRDAWRTLPEAPWFLPDPAAFAWTGEELVLIGSADRRRHEVSAMAYAPRSDTWRAIASAPLPLNQATAVWTGREVIVVGAELRGGNVSVTQHAQAMSYSPETDEWTVLPEPPISPQASSATWTGSEVLVWDYDTSSAAYDPRTGRWRELGRVPVRPSECYPVSARLRAHVLAWFCGQMAVFDIERDAWTEVEAGPVAPRRHDPNSLGEPVGAGEVVLLLLSRPGPNSYSGEINELWAYRPR